MASTYAEEGQYDAALNIATFLFMLDQHNPRNFFFMASVMQRMKNYESAEEVYNHITEMAQGNPLYQLNIGETKVMVGKPEEAAPFLKRCIELSDDSEDGRRYRQRAEKILKTYVEKRPE